MTELDKFGINCKQMYGLKTCILYEIKENLFSVKILDKNGNIDNIDRNIFYKFIPEMINRNYTVVIIENEEITTVHHPTQTNLITPPLIQ